MAKRRKKSYQANCEKLALTRRIRRILQRSYKLTFLGFIFIVGLIGFWLNEDDGSETVMDVISEQVYNLTAKAGLKLDLVTFKGDKYIGQAQLVEELGLFDGIPILALNLEELRNEIKTKNWVKEAQIRRELPSKLQIKIVERTPIAIWQYKHELNLIDEEGKVLTKLDSADGLPFPLIVGEGANIKATEIFSLLETEKLLYDRVYAAVRLSDRRWNVMFINGIEVMLPEENMQDAWKKLARMQLEKQVLDRKIKTIDLRMPDRVYIQAPGGKDALTSGRKSA
ncbi:MAG: hypothetical protein COV36_06745 [Alphaproteobacteria bacterium CG11_big_fil_rev_8_21_14_0_20_44_7]|nr:MAG: hypothetical protein COV36_06745 [Alphaproteobacteria bacterium CG11_big_fil_rev_8_21_14_0_20_44_7]